MNLVESSIWLLLVSMMATLNISKAVDEDGNVVEPKIDFNNPIFRSGTPFPSRCDADVVGFCPFRIPDVFKCDIRPRSEQALRLVQMSEVLS